MAEKETYSAHVREQNEAGPGLRVQSHCTSFRAISEVLEEAVDASDPTQTR